jgi:hypothetical protein
MLQEPVHVFDTRPAIEWRISQHKGVTGNKLMAAANPPYGALIHYSLKTAVPEKEDVKITVVDKSGKTIRELKGPKAAGLQTIAWDLRYEPPYVLSPEQANGFFFFGGGPRGPMVDPGDYTVKVAALGQSVETKVHVEEDPRIQLAAVDRPERMKTLLQISELQKRTDKVRVAIANERTELTKRSPAAPPALMEKVNALNKTVALGGFRENGDDPTEYIPPSITQRLMRLMSGIDGYTSKITGAQREDLAALTKEVGDLEASWKKFVSENPPSRQ